MPIAGLAMPQLSLYDPPMAGEGSLDPMGLAAISDRLASRLAPSITNRMMRIRFVTLSAVGSVVCEPLVGETAADDVSSPPICFEWLVIESFVRRRPAAMPTGVPGVQKAAAVVQGDSRLAASTYLKAPTVFGFFGVYKPFAIDAGVLLPDLTPGRHAERLVRAWEVDNGLDGFLDGTQSSPGGAFRRQLLGEVRAAMQAQMCATSPRSAIYAQISNRLDPGGVGARERQVLASLVFDSERPVRRELAEHLRGVPDVESAEHELLRSVRPYASPVLAEPIDAVLAFEAFAASLDGAFRVMCALAYGQGLKGVAPGDLRDVEALQAAARDLPARVRRAREAMAETGLVPRFDSELGVFEDVRNVSELVEMMLAHHERVQARKPPRGKRSWFEQYGPKVVLRYRSDRPPLGSDEFVHPVRIGALHRFVRQVAS